MIQLQGVEKIYRTDKIETVALSNINVAVNTGEFISIMGPSGSGKSTLLNVIGLLDVPTGGQVALNGNAITSYSDRHLARVRNEELGFIFQTFHLVNDLSVADNVEIPLLYRKGLSSSARRKLALAALDRVGLHARVHHFPSQLSGGQQQRAAIARALAMEPQVLLYDEPTSALDPSLVGEVLSIMRQLDDAGMTQVVVTHEMRFAREVADRIIVLSEGELIEAGDPEEIFTAPRDERTRQFLKNFL